MLCEPPSLSDSTAEDEYFAYCSFFRWSFFSLLTRSAGIFNGKLVASWQWHWYLFSLPSICISSGSHFAVRIAISPSPLGRSGVDSCRFLLAFISALSAGLI